MKVFAGSLAIAMIFVGTARTMSAPAEQTEESVPKLRTESRAVEPLTTPREIERRFGRDTLLYFPMERDTAAPVALQQILNAR